MRRRSLGRGAAIALTAVALLRPSFAGQAAEAEDEGGARTRRSYLKKDGDKWFRVVRDERDGSIRSRAAAAAPAGMTTSLSGAAGELPVLPGGAAPSPFKPYRIYPIGSGSWPEAVAIGDINGDGRSDVALVTSYYSYLQCISLRRRFESNPILFPMNGNMPPALEGLGSSSRWFQATSRMARATSPPM